MPSEQGCAIARPLLRGRVERDGGKLLVSGEEGQRFAAAEGVDADALAAFLLGIDGQRDLMELERAADPLGERAGRDIIDALDREGLIDDVQAPASRAGLEVLFELEDLTEELCAGSLYRNEFWRNCLEASTEDAFPRQVAHGLVIENYHFLFRESYFDAPVLSYVPNTRVRLAMNAFFAEEYGHDEILLRSLNTLGLTREDMADSIPLPETLGLCNALAFWSLNDPLFFFTTLGLLEGQGMKTDSFIDCCERIGLPVEFTRHLRVHSEINIKAGHGNLTRLIFSQIPAIGEATAARLRAQTHLFVELYDAFYMGVWRHYSSAPTLLRRVSEL